MPVAYTLCEALQAHQVYWAEHANDEDPLGFRQFLKQVPGEKVLLVDDILRSGEKLTELKALVESNGAEVVGLAVIVYQPNPQTADFGSLPLYYLAKLEGCFFVDESTCELCKKGVPVQEIRV